MVFRLQRTGKELLELELQDEDISIADVIHYEALRDKHVIFAGVVAPHPLQKRVILKIRTGGTDSLEALRRAAKTSLAKIEKLVSQLKEMSKGESRSCL
jgi:DNA-directed RNA polymerase subunit L